MGAAFDATELIGYAVAIVRERGITEAQLTPALLGDVLAEAVQRMDKLVTEMLEHRTHRAKTGMRSITVGIYLDAILRNEASNVAR